MGRIENINDIVGNTYGKHEVIGYLGCYAEFTDEHRILRQVYLCKCSCGRLKAIRRDSLIENRANSCGCTNGRQSMGKAEKWRLSHED